MKSGSQMPVQNGWSPCWNVLLLSLVQPPQHAVGLSKNIAAHFDTPPPPQPNRRPTPVALDHSKPTVTVCRGCCCGTRKKRPKFDHDAQLKSLRNLTEGVGNLRISDCLGPCKRANVIVISPSKSGKKKGGRPTWLGFVLDAAAATDISDWLRDGGPGLAKLPRALARYNFRSPK